MQNFCLLKFKRAGNKNYLSLQTILQKKNTTKALPTKAFVHRQNDERQRYEMLVLLLLNNFLFFFLCIQNTANDCWFHGFFMTFYQILIITEWLWRRCFWTSVTSALLKWQNKYSVSKYQMHAALNYLEKVEVTYAVNRNTFSRIWCSASFALGFLSNSTIPSPVGFPFSSTICTARSTSPNAENAWYSISLDTVGESSLTRNAAPWTAKRTRTGRPWITLPSIASFALSACARVSCKSNKFNESVAEGYGSHQQKEHSHSYKHTYEIKEKIIEANN